MFAKCCVIDPTPVSTLILSLTDLAEAELPRGRAAIIELLSSVFTKRASSLDLMFLG